MATTIIIVLLVLGIGFLLWHIKRMVNVCNNYEILMKQKNGMLKDWEQRVIHLEDAIKKEYGVQTRIVRNEVKCVFSKVELAIIQAGVTQLLGRPKVNVDDAQFYIDLIHKISQVLPEMEESVVTSESSSS